MKTIEITIDPQGKTKLETHGFAGNECQKATQDLEFALGMREASQLKSEFFQSVGIDQSQAIKT
ncbi:MAG: DUF2997 domain-containing protein [Pirellula sp.]|jgi:hypothetical protein|nr:DUF2997 domain-containing protein [Pirellula sp.]